MRAAIIAGMLMSMLLTVSPAPVRAQVANADYVQMVKRYMPRPAIPSLLSGQEEPVRTLGIEAPDTVQVGESRSFSVRSNVESAALPIDARWHFGDGTTARGLVTTHVFKKPGEYRVQVRLANDVGRAEQDHQLVVIEPDPAQGESQ